MSERIDWTRLKGGLARALPHAPSEGFVRRVMDRIEQGEDAPPQWAAPSLAAALAVAGLLIAVGLSGGEAVTATADPAVAAGRADGAHLALIDRADDLSQDQVLALVIQEEEE